MLNQQLTFTRNAVVEIHIQKCHGCKIQKSLKLYLRIICVSCCTAPKSVSFKQALRYASAVGGPSFLLGKQFSSHISWRSWSVPSLNPEAASAMKEYKRVFKVKSRSLVKSFFLEKRGGC
jgi:hypothetical protein